MPAAKSLIRIVKTRNSVMSMVTARPRYCFIFAKHRSEFAALVVNYWLTRFAPTSLLGSPPNPRFDLVPTIPVG